MKCAPKINFDNHNFNFFFIKFKFISLQDLQFVNTISFSLTVNAPKWQQCIGTWVFLSYATLKIGCLVSPTFKNAW